jgi:hypothetical protein
MSQHPEEVSVTQQHELGATFTDQKGRVFMYAIAGEALTGQGYVVQVDASGDAEMIDAVSELMNAQNVGIVAANEDVADNEYFWMCIKKPASDTELGVFVAVSCAADRGLYATATPGVLDDVTTSFTLIRGIRILTAQPTTAATMNTASEWNYPSVHEA